jgi:hypothetical protein
LILNTTARLAPEKQEMSACLPLVSFLDSEGQHMKQKPQFGFELGISNSGHIRLVQDRMYEKQQVILLSPDEATALIKEFRDALKNKAEWWNPCEGDE